MPLLGTPELGSNYTLCAYTNNVSLILIIIVFFLYKILSLLLMSKTLRHLACILLILAQVWDNECEVCFFILLADSNNRNYSIFLKFLTNGKKIK